MANKGIDYGHIRAGTSDSQEIFSTIWHVIWRFKGRSALAFCLLVAAKLFALLIPVALKHIIDSLEGDSSPLSIPVFLLLSYALLRFFSGLSTELRDLAFAKVTATAVADFTVKVFGHLHQLGSKFHGSQQTGVFARDVSRGTAGVGFLMGTALFTVLPTIIEIVSVVFILLSAYHLGFAVALLITFSAYGAYTIIFTEKRIHYQRALNELDSAASGHLVDSLMNYETVKLYTNEHAESQKLYGIMSRWIDVGVDNQKALSTLHIGQSAVIATGVAAIMLMAGRDVANGNLTVGDLVLINAYVIQVCLPLNTLGLIFRQIREALINAESMVRLLSLPVENAAQQEAGPLRVRQGEVRFEHVSFFYDPARPILHDISFEIEPAHHVAVVGGSGSGKSTLARLLLRLYEVEAGNIIIDGRDIRSTSHVSLRENIGVVPQESQLFNNTIFYNIAYGKPGASMEEVVAAARAARIHDLIESLPARYDTPVGERGVKLSGGERQRIAIARVFLKNPPILVMDEATSALDTFTERAIQGELRSLSQGRSSLIIAHRLSTIVEADLILVMDQGQIIERGTHAALLQKQGQYAKMWQLQLQQQALLETESRWTMQPVNLVALVATVLDSVRPIIDANGIALYTLIKTDTARVTGNPAALQRLMGDILENAIAFTAPGGRIEISVEREGTEISVAVTDSRHINRRSENLTDVEDELQTLPNNGSNMVLLDPTSVDALMRKMNGRFQVTPDPDGSGLRFLISMPVRAVVELEPRALALQGMKEPLRGAEIYVVDDQPEARELLGAALEDHGATTVRFESGEMVIATLNKRSHSEWPDVLVTDISLGEMDGYQMLARIRKLEAAHEISLAQRLPAIAVSGHSAAEDRLYALLAGFQLYMSKPVDARELVTAIRGLIGDAPQRAHEHGIKEDQ